MFTEIHFVVFQVFQGKIPDPMRCCGTYFVIFPNQESQLSRSVLSVSMTAKQDWNNCWRPPNLANVSKPIHARPENTAGRFYDSGRVQWQHRHNRGDYQCTGVNGQDYHHHTLGYHYHCSLDKAITIHHPRSGLLGGLQLQPNFITWKEFKNKWNIFKWHIWISLNL